MEQNPQCPEQEVQEETHFLSQSIIVMMALMGLNSIALSYLRKARNRYPFLTKYIQDATITTLIGIFAGAYLKVTGDHEILTTISNGYQELFMIILLPPILFESAINMHKSSFFKNIGTILMFAVLGTFIAALLTAVSIFILGALSIINWFSFGESFAFGALISATDPVTVLAVFKEMNANRNLYSLIFGESILNDAISIALYKTMTEISTDSYHGSWSSPIWSFLILFFGSVGLGFLIGLACATILKKYFGDPQPGQETTETTTMILIPWVSYLVGEAMNLSGIVTILFCGIAMTKYALPNLSKSGRILTKKLYQALSTTSEHLAFIFIGIGFFSYPHEWEKLGWIIFIMVFIIVTMSRFGQISIVTWIVNKFRPSNKISRDSKMVMTYSGFRGAMAFALASNATKAFTKDDAGSMMLTLTLVYATLTIFIFGSCLVPILEYYGVEDPKQPQSHENAEEVSVLDVAEKAYCWNKIKDVFSSADDLLIKLLIRSSPSNPQGHPLSKNENYEMAARSNASSSRVGHSHDNDNDHDHDHEEQTATLNQMGIGRRIIPDTPNTAYLDDLESAVKKNVDSETDV